MKFTKAPSSLVLLLGSLHACMASPAPAVSSGAAASNQDPNGNGSSISTVFFAPVTITPSANCLSKTSYSYITMRPLTGTLASLTSSLTTVAPWSITTIPGATPTAASGGTYLQVDVFLSQAPFSLGPNGEESAWAKACYDPRNTPLCPSNNAYGPSGVSCITGFPGAETPTKSTAPQATVFGPYKNAASRGSGRGAAELQVRLFWEVTIVLGLVGALGLL